MYQPAPVRGRLLIKCALVATSVVAVLVTASTAGPARADSSQPATEGGGSAPEGPELGRYVVTLADADLSPAGVSERSRGLAAEHGGEVGGVYSATWNGFTIETNEASARALTADPAVARVVAESSSPVRGS